MSHIFALLSPHAYFSADSDCVHRLVLMQLVLPCTLSSLQLLLYWNILMLKHCNHGEHAIIMQSLSWRCCQNLASCIFLNTMRFKFTIFSCSKLYTRNVANSCMCLLTVLNDVNFYFKTSIWIKIHHFWLFTYVTAWWVAVYCICVYLYMFHFWSVCPFIACKSGLRMLFAMGATSPPMAIQHACHSCYCVSVG